MAKILNNENSRTIVETILKNREGIEVIKPQNPEIDYLAKTESETYAIFVRYRNFPEQETKSRTLEHGEEQKFQALCGDSYIPTVAFVFWDNELEKIYTFIMTLDQMKTLVCDDNNFMNMVMHGIDLKIGVGKHISEKLVQQAKGKVDITEIQIIRSSGRKIQFNQ